MVLLGVKRLCGVDREAKTTAERLPGVDREVKTTVSDREDARKSGDRFC
jgi:hypothetical protein